jgi:hypothetical protein
MQQPKKSNHQQLRGLKNLIEKIGYSRNKVSNWMSLEMTPKLILINYKGAMRTKTILWMISIKRKNKEES